MPDRSRPRDRKLLQSCLHLEFYMENPWVCLQAAGITVSAESNCWNLYSSLVFLFYCIGVGLLTQPSCLLSQPLHSKTLLQKKLLGSLIGL